MSAYNKSRQRSIVAHLSERNRKSRPEEARDVCNRFNSCSRENAMIDEVRENSARLTGERATQIRLNMNEYIYIYITYKH